MTQVGQEPVPVEQAEPAHRAEGAPAQAGRDAGVRIEPGTMMQKVIPQSLVEPYLTGQRSVIAGFAHRVDDAAMLNLTDVWLLRWRVLQMQAYRIPPASLIAYGASQRSPDRAIGQPEAGRGMFEMFLGAAPIPVDTEMFQVTSAGEQFIARYDGQAWLRPAPEA